MTWAIGTIICVIDADTFGITVQQRGGPYAGDIKPNERIRMVNREVNALRPSFTASPYSQNPLIGKKVYCEVHSRSPDQLLVVTARPM